MKNFQEAIEVAKEVEEMLSDVSLPLRTALTCDNYTNLIGLLKQAETEAEMLVSQIRWAIKKIKKIKNLEEN